MQRRPQQPQPQHPQRAKPIYSQQAIGVCPTCRKQVQQSRMYTHMAGCQIQRAQPRRQQPQQQQRQPQYRQQEFQSFDDDFDSDSSEDSSEEYNNGTPDFNRIFGAGSHFQQSMNNMMVQMNSMNQMFNFDMNMPNGNFQFSMSSNQPGTQIINIGDFGIQISSNNHGMQQNVQFNFNDDDDYTHQNHRQQPQPTRGMKPTHIRQIPTQTYRRTQEVKSCCVCMADFKGGEKIKTLHCAHQFHDQCISEWLKQKAECPICRHKLV